MATVASDSDDEDKMDSTKRGDMSTTFKPYAGGSKRLSSEGFGSLPTDIKTKSAFTGLRDGAEGRGGNRIKRMDESDDESDEDRPRKKAGQTLEKEVPKAEPSTLAFTNDAISLEQVSLFGFAR